MLHRLQKLITRLPLERVAQEEPVKAVLAVQAKRPLLSVTMRQAVPVVNNGSVEPVAPAAVHLRGVAV
jgi:hypothetical protein